MDSGNLAVDEMTPAYLTPPDETPMTCAERCLADAKGDLVEFVRLFALRTNPGGIAEEVAGSTAKWEVQARRWLWKNFARYRGMVHRTALICFNEGRAYPIAPMEYPGFDAKGLDRSRARIRRQKQNKKRGVVSCQAIVDVNTRTGQSTVRIVSQSLDYLRKKAPELVAMTIDGQPWHRCRVEDALRWVEQRGAEVSFIRIIAQLCPDLRLSMGEQMTPQMIDEALAISGLG